MKLKISSNESGAALDNIFTIIAGPYDGEIIQDLLIKDDDCYVRLQEDKLIATFYKCEGKKLIYMGSFDKKRMIRFYNHMNGRDKKWASIAARMIPKMSER